MSDLTLPEFDDEADDRAAAIAQQHGKEAKLSGKKAIHAVLVWIDNKNTLTQKQVYDHYQVARTSFTDWLKILKTASNDEDYDMVPDASELQEALEDSERFNARFNVIEQRIENLDGRIENLDGRLSRIESATPSGNMRATLGGSDGSSGGAGGSGGGGDDIGLFVGSGDGGGNGGGGNGGGSGSGGGGGCGGGGDGGGGGATPRRAMPDSPYTTQYAMRRRPPMQTPRPAPQIGMTVTTASKCIELKQFVEAHQLSLPGKNSPKTGLLKINVGGPNSRTKAEFYEDVVAAVRLRNECLRTSFEAALASSA